MEANSVQEVGHLVEEQKPFMIQIKQEIQKVMVGQQKLVDRVLIGLLADGHILLEGVPGLAKTTLINTISQVMQTSFKRIQFTPDLLPADLLGTQIYSAKTGEFEIKKGPLFANIILADEINRAPAKVQSALLEAMQEKQVTLGDTTFDLPSPFLVMATQNPLEQEGTYPLPEAQLDRFMLKVFVHYPSQEEEIQIVKRAVNKSFEKVSPIMTPELVLKCRDVVDKVYVDDKLYHYVTQLVFATREPASYGLNDLTSLIQVGASPRASIFLVKAAKAFAFLNGRGYVTPQDIKTIGKDVLRHRVSVTYEAEAQNLNSEDIIQSVFDKVDVP